MSASATSSPAVGTSSSSSAAAAAASAAAQPVVLSRSLQTAISTMHARISKVFAAPSPMASPDLPAARSAVQAVVSDVSIPPTRPLPPALREVLSAAINPQMQALAKKCHASEHYSLLLGWLFQLGPLVSDQCIALEWWDFLIKPVLRDSQAGEGALAQAKALVLDAMCNAPADAYHDVEPPSMPWPRIDNDSAGNFARSIGDAPYSTFASAPAPFSPTETLRTASSSVESTYSPTTESSATAFRRRVPKDLNTLYRFAQRIVQLYFAEIASAPHVEPKKVRTRNSSASGAILGVGEKSSEMARHRALSGLGLSGIGPAENLGKSAEKDAQEGLGDVRVEEAAEEEMEEEDQYDEHSLCWTQRLEALVLAFGTRAPKRFFHHLSSCFAEPTNRIPVLVNLIAFISAHPATAYHLIATPLPAEVMMSLQIDTSTTVITLGARLAVMLLPHIPTWFANGGGGGLPALMAVFARIIDWRIFGNGWEERVGKVTAAGAATESEGSTAGDSAMTVDTGSQGDDGPNGSAVSLADEIINQRAALDIEWTELDRIGKRLQLRQDVQWSRLTSTYDGPDTAAPDATLLFTYLYGLFPANTIRFLRAPIDYLRKAHYVSPSVASFQDLIDELTIHERSKDIVRRHRLHEGLVLHGAEWEVCNPDRWKKSVTEEYAAVCMNHYLGTADGVPEARPGSLTASWAERLAQSSLRSGANTPTAQSDTAPHGIPGSSAMRPSLSAATLLTPALSISSSRGMSAVHRENLMLRTELNYELNLKGQLLHFIGKLHRDKLKSHVLAAEQQNLKSEVKVLRAELDRSRKERDKIREEADKRAKRLGNPTQRLRQFMEKDKRTTEELQRLAVELQSKEETNEALSSQLEAAGTELFEIKALWQQNEPALKDLDNLKAQVEQMQVSMKAWADTEARYEAQQREMRTMASKWTQLELERDNAEAVAREAMSARDEVDSERERWMAVAEEASSQLKTLQEKWAIKPPVLSHPSSGGAGAAHYNSMTPTNHHHMYATGAVFSSSSPSSPLLQATERVSRRQSMLQSASVRLLASSTTAASALLSENSRLTGALEDAQAEMLGLRAEMAVMRGSGAAAAAGAGTDSNRSTRSTGLEDVDVIPLDIGPAREGQEEGQDQDDEETPSPSSQCVPDYVFSTVRVFGGQLDEGTAGDSADLTQRLLPAHLRASFLERVRDRTPMSELPPAECEAEVAHRVPLLPFHIARLRDGRRAMQSTWPNAWVPSETSLSDKDLEDRILDALHREIQERRSLLIGEGDGSGSGPSDLRVRVEVDAKDEVTVTSAPTGPVVYEQQGEAGGLPTVRLDLETIDLFPALRGDEAAAVAMATCKTNRREAYQAAAARLQATYGAVPSSEPAETEVPPPSCFDGLLWTTSDEEASDPSQRLLTESSIANIVLEVRNGDETKLITPAPSSSSVKGKMPFLPGLLRNELVRLGIVEEADIPVERVLKLLVSNKDDDGGGETTEETQEETQEEGGTQEVPEKLWLCNAFRGLFEVQLVS
ncbi:unnamed protein product [Tilletia controversa]|nr:hypothetical protein CF335_g2991 [Tilletia laevis]CAD6901441.1 unnamed protein product [Tilletia caries]CAD6941360.1 unnamed protein product [Tilletia controversa]CAD6951087.1 unnamed protein product [Tilletia caries]CAD6963149.1 unnamed protein product [Tilletia controversa]